MSVFKTQNGYVIDEIDIPDYIEKQYTEDEHEKFLNDIGGEVNLFGTWTGYAGRIIRKTDPIFFRLSYQEEIDRIINEELEDYGITEVEDETEE